MDNQAPLWDPKKVADQLKLSVCSVYRLVRQGRLEYVKLGRPLRFRPAAIDQYLRECTVTPTPGGRERFDIGGEILSDAFDEIEIKGKVERISLS